MSDLVETLNLLANVWIQFMIRQSWQVGIVFLVVGAITLALRRRSAVLCYCLWLLVLIRFLLPPDFAFVTGAGHWLPRLGVQTEPDFAVSGPVDVAPSETPVDRLQIVGDLPRRGEPLPLPSLVPRYVPPREIPPAEIAPMPIPRVTLGAILMLVWVAMVVTVLALLMKRSRVASRILREGRPVTDDKTIALAEECRAAVRLRRPVRLLSSSRVPMPVAIGVLRPSVVVPDRLLEELSRDELRAVFLHEFLHLKRLDPLVSFVQRVVQAFYLYHPAAWLANGMLDVLRERICDDHVLSLMSTDSETYGETLVRAVELAPSGVPASGGLVSIAESKRQLKDRLQRIAQVDRKLVYRLSLASILALVCIAAIVLPLGQMDTGDIVEETEGQPAVPDKIFSRKGGAAKGAAKGMRKPGAKDETPGKRATNVLKGKEFALASSVNTTDVGQIEIVIFYSEPVRYLVTARVPIREIVAGLQEPTQPYVPAAGFTKGPDCNLVIVTDGPKIEVPLGLDYGRLLASVGDPPLTPPPRLKRILDIVLLRLTGVREVPTSDEDLPGGFASWEVRYPEREHDVEFALTLLDAVVDGYGRRSYLSDSDKLDRCWASAYRAELRGAWLHVDRVSADLNDFIAGIRDDMSVSKEFGGIPYAIRAELQTRLALGTLFERAKMYDRAKAEYEKLNSLLTANVISMATNKPTDVHPGIWTKASLRPHLQWLKGTRIRQLTDRCDRLSQEQTPSGTARKMQTDLTTEEESPEYRQYVEGLRQRAISTLPGNEKWILEVEEMGAQIGKGRRLKRVSKYDEAIAAFDFLVQEHPDTMTAVFVHHYMGDCYEALGEQNKADEVRRQGIETGKATARAYSGALWLPNVWFFVVVLYSDLDEMDEKDVRDMQVCAEKCDAGLEQGPDLLSAHVTCAKKLQKLGYINEAEEEYRHVLKPRALDERRMALPVREALRGLVELLAKQGRRSEVEEACRAVISDFPRNRRDAEELLGEAVTGPETSGPRRGAAAVSEETSGKGDAVAKGSGGIIAGYVRENGLALPGAHVILDDGIDYNTATDPQGYYEFKKLPPGTYDVWANPRRHRDVPHQYTSVNVQEGLTTRKDFEFMTGDGVIEGYVTPNVDLIDTDGLVFVFRTASHLEEVSGLAQLDENSFFRVENLAADSYLVRAHLYSDETDSGVSRGMLVEVEDGQTTRADINISGSSAITGTVSSPAGTYITMVFAEDASAPPPPTWNWGSMYVMSLGMAHCKSDGAFEITGLEGGTYNVSAACFENVDSMPTKMVCRTSQKVTLGDGESVELNFSLTETGQMDSGETDETTEESATVTKPAASPKTGQGKGAAKGVQKTVGNGVARDKGVTDAKDARRKVFGDPLRREFMRAYNALEFEKAVAIGEEFLEKYGNEPEALMIYGFVAGVYGWDDSIPEEVREERRKTVLERGIAACERALEKSDPVDKLGMLATLGRLCGMRAVGPGWHDEVHARKGIGAYREAIDIAESLLHDSDVDEVRRTASALLWPLYKGMESIYETQEDFPEAVAVYEEALKRQELTKRRRLIQQDLAETYHKWGKRVEEMETYLSAIEEAPIHKTHFKPSVKQAMVDMYRAAVSATGTQTLETLSKLADVYRENARLVARDAAAIAESQNLRQWRITSWQNLLPVADLLVDYCSQANAPERRDEFYTLLLKVWPEDERFESVVLVRLGKLYEEMGRRQDAVNAYRRVMAIEHALTMRERLEARSRLQDLGEEVQFGQGQEAGENMRSRGTETLDVDREESRVVTQSTTQKSSLAQRRLQFRWVVGDGESPSSSALVPFPTGPVQRKSLLVFREVLFDESDIESTQVEDVPQGGGTRVYVKLKPEAAQRFAHVTGENVGRRLAIVFDGEVISAPRVLTSIRGGKVPIRLARGQADAEALLAAIGGEDVPRAAAPTTPSAASRPAASTATVVGQVTDAHSGEPVAGLRVFSLPHKTTTASDGTYRLKNVPAGKRNVGAGDKEWYLVPHRQGAISNYYNYVQYSDVSLEPGKETRLDMQVIKGGRIEGIVADASGQPVADTYIWVVNQEESNSIVAAKTGPLGHFTSFGLAPRIPLEFLVRTSDGRGSARRVATLEPGNMHEINFTLDPENEYRITGSVYNSSGAPISGVQLGCFWKRERSGGGRWDAETDEQGRYWLSGLEPDTEYKMHAYGDSFGCATVTRTVRLSGNRRAVRVDFSLATEETVAPSETGAAGQPVTDEGADPHRTLCAANLKALSQVFHMYANEWNGRYPPIDGQRGNLMVEGQSIFPNYARYLDGVHTFQCPSREEHDAAGSTNPADAITDESYFYLGCVVTNEAEALALLDSYESLDLTERDNDVRVARRRGNAGGNHIYRIREGIERFFITDISDPAASAKVQDRIPVMWERPGNHSPAGGHVLYMSGRVEFVEYPGKFPMTAKFIDRLTEISTTETIKPEATSGEQPKRVIERAAPTDARTVSADKTAGVRKEPDIPEKPVVIRADTDERHRLDEYSYREESRDGVTHVLGTIYGSVVWEREKSPYVMDENVFVAQDSSLTIEPGVIVKVVRLPRGPCNNFGGRITLNVLGTLVAEGRPDAMIWFTAASDVPAERDEWSGLRFRGGSSASILKWAVVEYAMGGVDAFGSPLIAHCIFKYCTHAVYLERDFVGDVRHNVIAYSSNPIACTGTRAEATIINNISYAGFGGIHAWGNAAPYADYNLYWSSKIKDEASRYYRGIVPGPHDLQLDPGFVDPPDGNFRLVRSSPARGAGLRHAEKRPRMIRWMPLTGPKESDMGLFIRGWSRDSAKRETDEWVSDGARSLWYAGLQVERKWPEEAQQYYEQALQRDVAPELRYKIVCSLGRVLVALGQYEQAREILEQVLSESRLPHMRDLARREIAEAFASEGRTEEALALLKGTEWPQSHVWVESANATYAVAGGDYQDSLAYLDRLKRNEPGLYVKAVSDLISDRLAARQVEAAAALSEGFDAYPLCNAAPAAHLDIAKACRKAERPELAVQLLRKSCERDPFSKEAPESLSLLAEILESDLGREEEAAAVRARLCRNYFPFNSYVMDAHSILAETGVSLARTPRNKMILLDGTFSEWSIFDRRAWGTNYCSQHDVIRILTKAGYVVHTNRRERRYSRNAAELTPALLERYGLVVCNGRFRGRADPPMPSEVIETLVNYVQEGGSLLIVAGGKNLWEGGLAEFYNPLTQQFGLGFVEGADLEHGDGATTNHPAVRDLEKFVHVTGCPVRVEGGDVLGYAGDEPIIAVAQHGNGRVVAAGIGIGFAGGILGPTRHNADGMHPENEKLLVALASYLLSEVPERPVTTRQRTQRPRAQRERVPQKRGVEQIIPEPQRDFPQARQQSPDGRDSNSAAPLSIIPGEPVSEEEAREIVERLRSRLYLPRENLESLKCEFEPRFVDTTKYAQRWAEEMGEEPPIPKGAKVGHFEGTFIPSFLFLRDNGLSRAKKAVLYWEKVDANLPIERNVATVLLYDEQGNRINAHPAIGPALGSICLHHMHIHGHVPFWMVEPDERFQTHWRLDAPSDGPKTLYMVYNAVGQDAWNMAKVVFEDGDEALPLSAGTGRWHRRLQRWSPSESVEYGRLGKSGKVAIVRSGTDPYVLKYTWTNIGGAWVVSRVQGTTPDLEDFDMRKWVPWERTFTNFEINPQIPEGLLDWPSTPALKMDFSTPDAAIETIMNCLRAGREDLLPHCSVEPPDDPVPTEAMPNMMAYWFEEFDHMRDGLRVLEKRQEDEHWIYKVQIPQPTSGHRRSFDIKLVPVGDNWKMDVDIGLLLFQFWD